MWMGVCSPGGSDNRRVEASVARNGHRQGNHPSRPAKHLIGKRLGRVFTVKNHLWTTFLSSTLSYENMLCLRITEFHRKDVKRGQAPVLYTLPVELADQQSETSAGFEAKGWPVAPLLHSFTCCDEARGNEKCSFTAALLFQSFLGSQALKLTEKKMQILPQPSCHTEASRVNHKTQHFWQTSRSLSENAQLACQVRLQTGCKTPIMQR